MCRATTTSYCITYIDGAARPTFFAGSFSALWGQGGTSSFAKTSRAGGGQRGGGGGCTQQTKQNSRMAEGVEGVAKSRGHHIKGGQNQIPEKGGKLCKTCRLLRGGKRGRIFLELIALKVSSIPLVLYCYLYLDLYCVSKGQIQFLITNGLYVCVIFSKSFWYFMIQHSSLIGFSSSIKSLNFNISLLTFIHN